MKRILIIAEQYYPLMVPGAFRVASFARYLPECGFEPIILAPNWNHDNAEFACHGKTAMYVTGSESYSPCEVNQYRISERRETAVERYFNAVVRRRFPRLRDASNARQRAEAIHRNEPYNAVIASGPPQFVWHVASDLSKIFDIPWVADVRDVSGQIVGYDSTPVPIRWMKRFLGIKNIERDLLNSAAFVMTVSDPLREILRSRGIPRTHVILNGFEELEYQQDPHVPKKFRILHAGSIHAYRDPSILLDAVDEIVTEMPEVAGQIEIAFYGNVDQAVCFFHERPCQRVAICHPVIGRLELIPLLMGSNILLHLSTAGSKGILTSKLMEYLGAGQPILTIPGDGDVVDAFLKETGSGISCSTVQCAKEFVLEQWQRWNQGLPSNYQVSPAVKRRYTRRIQCERLAKLLLTTLEREAAP